MVFDKPFDFSSVVKSGIIDDNSLEAVDSHAGGIIGFKTSKGEKVNAKVASSFISHEQAELNLKELDGKNFDEVAKTEEKDGMKYWAALKSMTTI